MKNHGYNDSQAKRFKKRRNPEQLNSVLTICPSCAARGIRVFHEVSDVPVHSVLNFTTREKAINYKRGNIKLGFCGQCGFISNTDFDPSLTEYSSNCEESQGFSSTFNTFARNLAAYLVDKYDLYDKDILEIGCGKGEFLTYLCEQGNNRGIGFDPAYVDGRTECKTGGNRISFIRDFYSEKYSAYRGDLVCCRMTLEHVSQTRTFIRTVRRSIGDDFDTIVFFQVPDVTRILCECAFEDIYYEHCSYFSPGSISRLFRRCDFEVLDLRTAYDDQYILLEAKPATNRSPDAFLLQDDLAEIEQYVLHFPNKYMKKLRFWQKKLSEMKALGKRMVIWGSGSKGVSFLNTVNLDHEIEYVVDINPYRQRTYMAGTGQRIVPPSFLKGYKPDLVLIMNAIYREEIIAELDQLGLSSHILTLEEGV